MAESGYRPKKGTGTPTGTPPKSGSGVQPPPPKKVEATIVHLEGEPEDSKTSSEPYSYRRWASDYWSKYNKPQMDAEAARVELLELQALLSIVRQHIDLMPPKIKAEVEWYDKSGKEFHRMWEDSHKDCDKCPKCGGEGWLWSHELKDYKETGHADDTQYHCDKCRGFGWVLSEDRDE